MMSKPITAVLFGAGLRGAQSYAPHALEHPDELKFVAVAEPDPVRRAWFAEAHNIPPERQFATWKEVLAHDQMADVVINATQDRMHHASGVAALEAGYDMLLEKPMTDNLADTVALVQAAERNGRFMQICHVLRYTPFFTILHDILASGRIGDIISVEHRENVSYWHMAHSFVRGNWGNESQSSPMILAKCCHDLDILYWNLGHPVKRLHSFGSLKHYRPENAPPGATARCTDDCPAADDCPFDARTLYLNMNNEGWPVKAISNDLSYEGRVKALETGPYGRCVYHADNDVVDNQIVSMEFENGATVALIMHGHSHEEGRTMRYDGTRGTLRGKFTFGGYHMEVHDHKTGLKEEIDIPFAESGHGGGDAGIMRNFVRALRGEEKAMTTARESLESHLMAFAAEESRHEGTVVDMVDFRHRAEHAGAGDR
jgi:predicted dehydrogenase